MQFKDVIGQEALTLHLGEIVQHNRLSHALLFLGKEGSGALAAALAFAQYVVCDNKNGDSCGVCSACSKAAKYIHPDIHYSYPVISKKSGDKPVSSDFIQEWREFVKLSSYGNAYDWLQFIGAENKQGNITAHECNDIIRKLSLKSFESEFKILLMWLPEYLGNEGNKLLKLIEEPPPNTLFILVAENESLILQTILSRCQLVKVPLPGVKDIEKALISRAGLSSVQARQLAGICEGNYREALQLMQHAGEDWQETLREWLNAILKTGPVSQVKWIEEVSKSGREKQKQFLRYFTHLLEQSIRLRIMGTETNAISIADNEMDFALRLNKMTDIPQQQAIIEELDKATYYVERNANPKMLFHALTIKLYHIIKDKVVISSW
ncbi:MAG: hypothetical protein H7Y03_07565 [Chitinophagaceae bacterium]|nr:hypothetical protein [Chitinophagaceae bacterium]